MGREIHLTYLNAKTEADDALVAEFNRIFGRESPEALEWAFRTWRSQSPFFPAISDIRKLLADWRRGERERLELEGKMDEQFLLEQRRAQGLVPSFAEVVKELKAVAENVRPQWMGREGEMRKRMKPLMEIIPTLDLSEDDVRARREKERAEVQRHIEEQRNG